MNDEVIVSNLINATSFYILVFVQDKVAAYVTNIHRFPTEFLSIKKMKFLALGDAEANKV